jgi:hypothetical protein
LSHLGDEDREFIEEHLAEGNVFLRYRLIEKAIDQFEAVVVRFPDEINARRALRAIRKPGQLVTFRVETAAT